MITCCPSEFSPLSYHSEFRPSAPVVEVRAVDPGQFEQYEVLIDKLGRHGWGRVMYFEKHYSRPWGQRAECSPFSKESLRRLYSFVEKMPNLEPLPSVFLTDSGNLELGWKNELGQVVSIEFTPSHMEYYIEKFNEEESLSYEDAKTLLDKLKS